ncbi:BnaC03g73250D [Brassica napus]|uniref:BnaC03g73250D protein n=1 Tax=Brassica napus TaxID=3708 RepID=A0A078JBT7_BRANA|nr:BnaC03g73250D [Brassica napus]
MIDSDSLSLFTPDPFFFSIQECFGLSKALENVKAALASSETEHKAETKKRAIPRKAAGQSWEDPTLAEWPENDYRLFCGDLGNEVNDDVLSKAFARFPTFNMAKVIRDKRTGRTKGYGFVSFLDPADLAAALKEMNGKYVGNRPIKLRKSSRKERTDQEAAERQKAKKKDGEEEERTPQVINPWYSEGRDVQLSCSDFYKCGRVSLEVAGPRPKQ